MWLLRLRKCAQMYRLVSFRFTQYGFLGIQILSIQKEKTLLPQSTFITSQKNLMYALVKYFITDKMSYFKSRKIYRRIIFMHVRVTFCDSSLFIFNMYRFGQSKVQLLELQSHNLAIFHMEDIQYKFAWT